MPQPPNKDPGPSGKATTLTQLSVYTPYKTLGTFQCPGSKQRAQAEALVKKSRNLIRTLATSTCRGHSAWLFYSRIFCKSVGYPLAVSRLDDKKLLQIQGPMIPVILNRMGYERRLAHCLVFGPRRFGGLGVTRIRTSKALSQLSLFVRTLRTPGLPQRLTMINLHRIQVRDFPYLNHLVVPSLTSKVPG